MQDVERCLEEMDKLLRTFNLDHLNDLQYDEIRRNRDVSDAINASVPLQCVNARKELNVEQRTSYKSIIHHVKAGKPCAFFIDGPGDTGKTFLYCALCAKVRSMGKIVLPTATSGISCKFSCE